MRNAGIADIPANILKPNKHIKKFIQSRQVFPCKSLPNISKNVMYMKVPVDKAVRNGVTLLSIYFKFNDVKTNPRSIPNGDEIENSN